MANARSNSNTLDFTEYNWDELSVGNFEANCSKRFFGRRHPEHEINGKRNENEEDAENDFNMNNFLDDIAEQEAQIESKLIEEEKNKENERKPNVKRNAGTVAQEKPKEFRVVQYDKIYKTRQQHRAALEEQKRKELRSFQSKPAPNFQAIHAASSLKRAQEQIHITVPSTPKVMQRHREGVERIRKKQEELRAAQAAKPFKPNVDPEVLRSDPFVPKPSAKPPTQSVPFNLQSNERSKVRHQYNEEMKLELERKQKEEEELRQRSDEQVRRELRKATTFKARPNPFASH